MSKLSWGKRKKVLVYSLTMTLSGGGVTHLHWHIMMSLLKREKVRWNHTKEKKRGSLFLTSIFTVVTEIINSATHSDIIV